MHNIKSLLSVTHQSNQHTLEKIRLLTRLIERVFSQLIDESFDPSNVRKYRRNHNFSVSFLNIAVLSTGSAESIFDWKTNQTLIDF